MPKKNTKDQIVDIEEQIRRLREKQKRILTNSQKEIGKHLMESWEIEDVEEAKALIETFKDQVISLKEVSSSTTENMERNKADFINPIGE
ncbi:hypothetical protein [Mesobacillus foraminis]|uniref:Uncharacterized protein n=1 Tax=Mesobacillus foraminis TaxID=279826 RepID=A0A4R2AWW8_9BACI|nr:hypothetical protein [Mesobacillus foraminis]TCN18411.1 hypothetical protein EV146_1209 [Mesobacillus foraminis]